MNQSTQATPRCELRERLLAHMSQTRKALIEAQELQLTEMRPLSALGHSSRRPFGADLIAAATAWKQARLSYERHIREHGCSPMLGMALQCEAHKSDQSNAV
jgi:hypothetical protein